jgi:hypothetical protein
VILDHQDALTHDGPACASTRTGTVKLEPRPLARLGFHPDPTAVHLDDALGDRQPQTCPAFLAGDGAIRLLELLEDLGLIGEGNAGFDGGQQAKLRRIIDNEQPPPRLVPRRPPTAAERHAVQEMERAMATVHAGGLYSDWPVASYDREV